MLVGRHSTLHFCSHTHTHDRKTQMCTGSVRMFVGGCVRARARMAFLYLWYQNKETAENDVRYTPCTTTIIIVAKTDILNNKHWDYGTIHNEIECGEKKTLRTNQEVGKQKTFLSEK